MNVLILILGLLCQADKVETDYLFVKEDVVATKAMPDKTTVKVTFTSNGVTSQGSGNVIYIDKSGTSYILSSGHRFLFPCKTISVCYGQSCYLATLVDYDVDNDISLVKVNIKGLTNYSPIVPRSWLAKPSMSVHLYGYPKGDPSVVNGKILNVDLSTNIIYDNVIYKHTGIVCNFVEDYGASGGGLFTDDGYLIANYVAAIDKLNQSKYTSTVSVYNILQKNGLSFLIKGVAPARPSILPSIAPQPSVSYYYQPAQQQYYQPSQTMSCAGST